jgi:PHD/YefM family antitoxin component YafN of YafNO toxin-antitoxin module
MDQAAYEQLREEEYLHDMQERIQQLLRIENERSQKADASTDQTAKHEVV